MKICTLCHNEQSLSSFFKHNKNKDGLTSWCKKCSSQKSEEYRTKHEDEIREQRKQARVNNKETKKEIDRRYYAKNKEKIKNQVREYRLGHKELCNTYRRTYDKNRREKDTHYKMMKYLRTRNYKALKGKKKPRSLEKNCGFSGLLMDYIETTFYSDQMTPDNYGSVWELDHILPLASFDLTDPVQYVKANHYTNLQALLVDDNKEKSGKLDWIHPNKRKG